MIQGNGADRRSAVETCSDLDVDWMRGQSVGIFPIHNSTPEPIITELEKIMDSGEGGLGQGMVKFQLVNRLNAILVVARKPGTDQDGGELDRAADTADTDKTGVKVYRVHYGSAKQVAGCSTRSWSAAAQAASTMRRARSRPEPACRLRRRAVRSPP